MKTSGKGFTLIEMLAIIAITAILAPLLLGAISGAEGKAQRIVGTPNLRQINLGGADVCRRIKRQRALAGKLYRSSKC
jgi:hypothetical protein